METYVSSLSRRLSDRGHKSDVATLDYLFKTNEPLPHFERIDDIDVIRLPSSGNPRYFFAPRLMELAPRYDVIHVHGVDFFVDLLGACKGMHERPVVLSTHGGFFHTPWFPALKSAFFQTVTRFSLRGIDRVIASSPKDEKLFSRICRNVTLVDNGIDYDVFAAVEKPPSLFEPASVFEAAEAGGGDARGTGSAGGAGGTVGAKLVFVGRISKNKRVDRLLEILARLRAERPGVTLTVIGPDWEGLQPGLQEQAAALGISEAVTFKGVLPQDKMLDELASAKLFVSASEYEAFGLSTVEAMATGTVPAVSNIPAFMGLVEDGKTGFILDFDDPAAAAAKIREALELPGVTSKEMSDAARRAASQHDWDKVIGRIINIYEEVLAGHERSAGGS